MSSRMDKYKDNNDIPTRSNKNKELYKQIYNAYDSFENLIVPSNAREINPNELKKEITSRDEYRRKRDYDDIHGNKTNNTVIRKEQIKAYQKQEEEVYDINELLNKAVSDKKEPDTTIQTLSNKEYLKRLKLDNRQMNLDKLKEQYDEDNSEEETEDESLMKTANLSLEILSDLKSDSGKTVVSAPIKNEELPKDDKDNDFYSNTYKFSKKDFEDKDNELDDEEDDIEIRNSNGKFFLKIFIIVLGIVLLCVLLMFLFNYLNRV